MSWMTFDPRIRQLRRIDGLLELDRSGDALRLVLEGLAESPEDPSLLTRLALAQQGESRFEEALDAAERACAAAPEMVWPHTLRAHFLLRLDQVRPAAEAAHEALRLDPDATLALEISSRAALRLGDLDQAERNARDLVTLDPEWPWSHFAVASVAIRRKRWVEAENALREAVRLDPEDPLLLQSLGEVLLKRGKRPEAAELLQAGAEQDLEDKRLRRGYLDAVGEEDSTGLAVTTLVFVGTLSAWWLGWWTGPKVVLVLWLLPVVLLFQVWGIMRRRSFRLTPRGRRFLALVEAERAEDWLPGFLLLTAVLGAILWGLLTWAAVNVPRARPSFWMVYGVVTVGELVLVVLAPRQIAKWRRSR